MDAVCRQEVRGNCADSFLIMKNAIVFFIFFASVSAKDTISFPENNYPSLYQTNYSYSYDRDWDDRDRDSWDDRDGNYPCVPEPSTFSFFAGFFALSVAIIIKRKKN